MDRAEMHLAVTRDAEAAKGLRGAAADACAAESPVGMPVGAYHKALSLYEVRRTCS